jgi:hypothetical protein
VATIGEYSFFKTNQHVELALACVKGQGFYGTIGTYKYCGKEEKEACSICLHLSFVFSK